MKRLLLLSVLFLVFLAPGVQGQDWPKHHLYTNATGYQPGFVDIDANVISWSIDAFPALGFNPVMRNGEVFFLSKGYFIGANASTGGLIRNVTFNVYTGGEGGLTIGGDTLFIGHYQEVFAVNLVNNATLWRTNMTHGANNYMDSMGIAFYDDRVFGCPYLGEQCSSLDSATGNSLWNFSISVPSATPGIWEKGGDGTNDIEQALVFFGNGTTSDNTGTVVAVNASTGVQAYSIPFDEQVQPQVVVAYGEMGASPDGDMCFVGDWEGEVKAWYCQNGTIIWGPIDYTNTTGSGEVIGSPAFKSPYLHIVTENGNYYKVFAANGSTVCNLNYTEGGLPSPNIRHAPALSDDMLYFGMDDVNKFVGVYTENCTVRWTYTGGGKFYFGHPIIANGMLFANSHDPNATIYAWGTWIPPAAPPAPAVYPHWSNVGDNSTATYPGQNDSVSHWVFWDDSDSGMDSYRIEWNGTGTLINITASMPSGNWTNFTREINASSNSIIWWRVWVNDSSNNWNSTDWQSYTVYLAAAPPPATNTTICDNLLEGMLTFAGFMPLLALVIMASFVVYIVSRYREGEDVDLKNMAGILVTVIIAIIIISFAVQMLYNMCLVL